MGSIQELELEMSIPLQLAKTGVLAYYRIYHLPTDGLALMHSYRKFQSHQMSQP